MTVSPRWLLGTPTQPCPNCANKDPTKFSKIHGVMSTSEDGHRTVRYIIGNRCEVCSFQWSDDE